MSYLVLGAGMQGKAIAYDLVKFTTGVVILADITSTRNACQEISFALDNTRILQGSIDATSPTFASDLLDIATNFKIKTCISAIPYEFNLKVTEACIAAKINLVDLGGNNNTVKEQYKLDLQAKNRGVTILPDCGLMPGLGNILAAGLINDPTRTPKSVKILCGGLPENPKPPLDYKLAFNIKGLTNEYFDDAIVLRNGEIITIPGFSELEEVQIDGKTFEAFVTSGGVSTAPVNFQRRISDYQYKTLRYPGHHQKLQLIRDLGLLSTDPEDFFQGTCSIKWYQRKLVSQKTLILYICRLVAPTPMGRQQYRPL
jgi:lysine 6-dehydrogenase